MKEFPSKDEFKKALGAFDAAEKTLITAMDKMAERATNVAVLFEKQRETYRDKATRETHEPERAKLYLAQYYSNQHCANYLQIARWLKNMQREVKTLKEEK
jgi:hypothetical protein